MSAFIGLLLTALPGTGADVRTESAHITASSTASSTAAIGDRSGIIDSIRLSLLSLRSRLGTHGKNEKKSTNETDTSEPSASTSDEDRLASGSTALRGRSNEGEHGSRSKRQMGITTNLRNHDDDEENEDDRGDLESRNTGTPSAVIPQIPRNIASGSSSQTAAAVSTFTLADVAKHNSVTSCYTVVSGSVYDVTAWISQHPGGQAAIKGMCGIDGTAAFSGQHGGQARPTSELASFKIGTLR